MTTKHAHADLLIAFANGQNLQFKDSYLEDGERDQWHPLEADNTEVWPFLLSTDKNEPSDRFEFRIEPRTSNSCDAVKGYSDWKRGDILRVVEIDPGDPFEVGDLVEHSDQDGDRSPYVTRGGEPKWSMTNEQLEFVERPQQTPAS